MPDFCQGDKRYGKLPDDGSSYCGPVALSNILIYLDRTNCPDLIPGEKLSKRDQFTLIKLLGSKKYIQTSPKTGTEPLALMRGLIKYASNKGYKISIKWKGWHDGRNYSTGEIPDQNWIAGEIKDFSNAILHIGWYKYDVKKDFYKRIGGHYVSVVRIKDDKIIIHDPSIRSGIGPKDEYCRFVPIKSGTLSKWHKYKARPAKGYSKIEGLKIKEGADVAIVDGAIVFSLRKI